jgi:hypothetical protein
VINNVVSPTSILVTGVEPALLPCNLTTPPSLSRLIPPTPLASIRLIAPTDCNVILSTLIVKSFVNPLITVSSVSVPPSLTSLLPDLLKPLVAPVILIRLSLKSSVTSSSRSLMALFLARSRS